MADEVLKSAGGALRTIAPTLTSALGGPFASQSLAALSSALSLDAGVEEVAIAEALCSASGSQLVSIKSAEIEFAKVMKELGVDLTLVRGRSADHVASVATTDAKGIAAKAFAIAIAAGFFAILGLLSFHAVPIENKEVVNILLGALTTTFVSTAAYFFGSNVGSRAKDQLLLAASAASGAPAAKAR